MFSDYLKSPKSEGGCRQWRKERLAIPQIAIESLEDRRLLSAVSVNANAQVSQNWTAVTTPVPGPDFSAQMAMLLSDGTLLVHGGDSGNYSSTWYSLAPDSTGGYVNGTWSQRDSMNVGRLYFASNVLQDGRVFVVGGEYASDQSFSRSAEIYDPVSDTWTTVANSPQSIVGDEPSALLPDGRVLVGNIANPGTTIYDAQTNLWSTGGTKIRSDETSDEESWVKLPDGSILTYDIFASINAGKGLAERYIPSTHQWIDASAGTLPLLSTASEGYELGGAILLPDGRAFFGGANGKTAFYDSVTNTWSQGPDMPVISGIQTTMGDAPVALMPNGHLMLAVSPEIYQDPVSGTQFPGPTRILDFNPNTGVYTDITPDSSLMDLSQNSYVNCMLVLPTGQIMLTNFSDQVAIYTPDGSPNNSWRPTITKVSDNADGSYTLTGLQLNGLSEGAAYGDDNEMSSNYPLIRITDTQSGDVYFARTYNWSSTGVATGSTPQTVQFTLPKAINGRVFSLEVVANGISSTAISSTTFIFGEGLGIFRPGESSFYIDANLSRTWDGSQGDQVFKFGLPGDIPLAGDWNGDGIDQIGVFRKGIFYLDYNGNGVWDQTSGGDKVYVFGASTDIPVVGDWDGDGKTDIGTFRNGKWILDLNGNGHFDGVPGGDGLFSFGTTGDVPVVGDWTGSGKSKLGVFRNGRWFLDLNHNYKWDGPIHGDASPVFGQAGDIPVAGDWNGNGKDKLGVYRAGTFYLDVNGNRAWNNLAGGDYYVRYGNGTDRPIVGLWTDPKSLGSKLPTSSLRSTAKSSAPAASIPLVSATLPPASQSSGNSLGDAVKAGTYVGFAAVQNVSIGFQPGSISNPSSLVALFASGSVNRKKIEPLLSESFASQLDLAFAEPIL